LFDASPSGLIRSIAGLGPAPVRLQDQVPGDGRGDGTDEGGQIRGDPGVHGEPAGGLCPGGDARRRPAHPRREADDSEARAGEHQGTGRGRAHPGISHVRAVRGPVDISGVRQVEDHHEGVSVARPGAPQEAGQEVVYVAVRGAAHR
jgi:hypothetical protein